MFEIFSRLMPALVFCATLVIFGLAIILSLYVLYYLALFGLIIFAITWLKNKLFPSQSIPKAEEKSESGGRIIDHDEIKQ